MGKKLVILLSGEINSGKNHAYGVLEEAFKQHGQTVHHVFFAKKLKDLCNYTFERYVQHLNSTLDELITKSNQTEVKELASSLKIAPHNWYEDKTESTRLILQDMGTRFARENVDDEFWPKKVVTEILSQNAPVVIATDFRFPNEYEVVKRELPNDEYIVTTLRIERKAGNSDFILNHPSEKSLSDFPFGHIIDNCASLEQFEENISNYFSSIESLISES